jgi:hypothetical protein
MGRAGELKAPRSGDDLARVILSHLADLDYVDGAQWHGQNGRVGGPNPGSVGLFGGDGRRGLPTGVASVVRHVDRESVRLLLHNTTAAPARLILTGGAYGQHRIESVGEEGKVPVAVRARRAEIELAPKASADLTLRLTRHAFAPTLTPQR